MNVLETILEQKRQDVAEARNLVPESELHEMAARMERPRGFRRALLEAPGLALVAEVKKASPSKGLIRAQFDPVEIAQTYEAVGANCLSVLTDERHFQGSLVNLKLCREATRLPCLRKDFLYEPYQIVEARAWGADAVLLIVAMLDDGRLGDLYGRAKDFGMDVLVEVHTKQEAARAIDLGADLIGVNNRDLKTLKTDLSTSAELLPLVCEHAVAVGESALKSHEDLLKIQGFGAKAVLIGTAFCAAPDIGAKVKEVMGW